MSYSRYCELKRRLFRAMFRHRCRTRRNWIAHRWSLWHRKAIGLA